MNTDIDIIGIFVPPMVISAAIAFVIWLVLKRWMAISRLYRFISHRNLFDISLYFVVLAGMLAAFGGKTIIPLF
ncbi:DUF1656 domain-containing protein [Burkholderia cenocepacia]|uniref:DUF1656 domain-containing protein n=1 Tax=Burkholderia cenocepacia TaxID=95486 RepID=UPI0008464846|nr:DUF1656 domain-containing protein [Burkholderia cenocepacia]